MSPARKKAASKKGSGRKPAGGKATPAAFGGRGRWLVLPAGLLLAAAAAWALLAGDGSVGPSAQPPVASPPHVHREGAPTEHLEYDEQSREQLREILRQADEEGSP